MAFLTRFSELWRRLWRGRRSVPAEVAPPTGAQAGSRAGLGPVDERLADAPPADEESNVVPMTFEDR